MSTVSYDADGNPSSFQGQPLTWDAEDRLVSVGTLETNTYTADGLRASATTAAGTTYFLYDGGTPVCEVNASGQVTALNTWGATGLLSRTGAQGHSLSSQTSTFYSFDQRGATAQRFDLSGDVVSTHAFDTYGAPLQNAGPVTGDPYSGFGGQEGYYHDDATGLYLLGHRFYDPSSGRFLNRDPAGMGNLYAYADGNPEDESDPTGFDPGDDDDLHLDSNTNAGSSYSGAYTMFKKSPQFANGSAQRQDTSNGLQQLPGVGPLLCGYIAVTGCDPIAGTPVSGLNRGFALLGALGPMFEALHEAEWCEMLGNGCFAKGTMVLMADGSHKPIQTIQVGDWVLSRNEATGETEARQVTGTTAHLSAQTVTVTLTDPKTHKTQAIVCTPNHPFYVQEQGFTPAGSLGIGTSIVTRAGPCLAVAGVTPQPASAGGAMVYNLTVEGDHTYFVGTLGGGAWVHNACSKVFSGGEGHDLAQLAEQHRMIHPFPKDVKGNLAVFEYLEVVGDETHLQNIIFSSDAKGHAEEHGIEYFEKMGTLGSVTRVYSEYHPCPPWYRNCYQSLMSKMPQARLFYGKPFGGLGY